MANFEDDMIKLEKIVDKLENGNVSLEESIKLYEQGKKISATCYDKLKKAELKITELSDAE